MKLAAISVALGIAFAATAAVASDIKAQTEAGAGKGLNKYMDIYSQTGMAGLEDAVTECYHGQQKTQTVEGIAECAALDFRASGEDAAFAARTGLQVGFFKAPKPMKRVKAAVKPLKLSAEDQKAFFEVIGRL
ncbi:hypothetical protein [Rhizobium sp. BK176]|uniref:hypothetical protein n=1 Tax=Rhizobium sp. BK176 TaxID=2587071 RepID=UPI00216A3D7E|nr:hypothetical protein [Rhizobium sp. BK176]MCS4089240.1 hypothetical protein [Rhizobium sp. BK176]